MQSASVQSANSSVQKYEGLPASYLFQSVNIETLDPFNQGRQSCGGRDTQDFGVGVVGVARGRSGVLNVSGNIIIPYIVQKVPRT